MTDGRALLPDAQALLPEEDDAFTEAVRKTAYFLWEQDGRPHGRHDEYYLRALAQHRRERQYDQWLEDGPDGE